MSQLKICNCPRHALITWNPKQIYVVLKSKKKFINTLFDKKLMSYLQFRFYLLFRFRVPSNVFSNVSSFNMWLAQISIFRKLAIFVFNRLFRQIYFKPLINRVNMFASYEYVFRKVRNFLLLFVSSMCCIVIR